MAQKKKTASGGKKNTKKTPAKKQAQPKLTAAEKRAEKEEAIREATVRQRVGSEVLGVVLIALGVLLGLYLYRTTDAPLGLALQKVLFGSVGVVAFGGLLLLQAILFFGTRNHTPIHDLFAQTITVDMASQLIFDSPEDMLAYKKRISEENAENAKY